MRTWSSLLVLMCCAACATPSATSVDEPSPEAPPEEKELVFPDWLVPDRRLDRSLEHTLSERESLDELAEFMGLDLETFKGVDWPCTLTDADGDVVLTVEYGIQGLPKSIDARRVPSLDLDLEQTLFSYARFDGQVNYVHDPEGLLIHEYACKRAFSDECTFAYSDTIFERLNDGRLRTVQWTKRFGSKGGKAPAYGYTQEYDYDAEPGMVVVVTERGHFAAAARSPQGTGLRPRKTVPYDETFRRRAFEGISLSTRLERTVTVDDAGRRVRVLVEDVSWNGARVIDSDERYAYDDQGRMVERAVRRFWSHDGSAKADTVFTYTYDEERPTLIRTIAHDDHVLTADYSCHAVQ